MILPLDHLADFLTPSFVSHIMKTQPASDLVSARAKRRCVRVEAPLTKPHPLSIRPVANALVDDPARVREAQETRIASLGALSALDDALLCCLLRSLPLDSLLALRTSSRVLCAFCALDELWKLRDKGYTHWFSTLSLAYARRRWRGLPSPRAAIYSDFLYFAWLYESIDLAPFMRDNVPRRSGLTPEQFLAEYAERNLPVVLTDVTQVRKLLLRSLMSTRAGQHIQNGISRT